MKTNAIQSRMSKTIDIQTFSAKNRPISIVDKRDWAINQLKMINTIRTSSKGNTIQCIRDTNTREAMAYAGGVMKQRIRKFLGIDESNPEAVARFNQYLADDNDAIYDHDVKFALNLVSPQVLAVMGTAADMKQIAVTKNIGGVALQIPKMVTKKVKQGGSPESIYIIMPPVPMLGDGAVVGFIQTVQSPKVEGAAKMRRFEYEAREKDIKDFMGDTTPVNTGWTIDRQAQTDPKNPFFGLKDDDSEGSGCKLGSNKDYAILTDAPTCQDGQDWHPRFETSAIVKACPAHPALVNTVLATVKWGGDGAFPNFVWNNFEELPQPSNKFISAAQVWNDYYSNDPTWKRVPALQY